MLTSPSLVPSFPALSPATFLLWQIIHPIANSLFCNMLDTFRPLFLWVCCVNRLEYYFSPEEIPFTLEFHHEQCVRTWALDPVYVNSNSSSPHIQHL